MTTKTTAGPLPTSSGPAARTPWNALTEDDHKAFMRLACQGMTDEEIAGSLFVALRSVRRRRSEAIQYLGARNIAQAALLASRKGWLRTPRRKGPSCGTESARQKHLARGENCDQCRDGHSKRERARRQRRRDEQRPGKNAA